MAINLQKGQRIDLTKGNSHLNQIMVGLGWDPVSSHYSVDIDCDASVIMLQDDHFINRNDLIYFGNLTSDCGSIRHSGDNLTGEGEGDDESIMVDLKSVPQRYNRLIFVVNIYDCESRGQDFGMIQNAFIRVVNPQTNEELLRFNLTDNYGGLTTLVTGEIYRHNGEWKFAAIGNGTTDRNLSEIISRYR